MQRYDFAVSDSDSSIKYGPFACAKPSEHGDFARYSDVLPLEKRLKELEAALQRSLDTLVGWCEAVDHKGTGWDDWDEWFKDAYYARKGNEKSVIEQARAALEAPHGP